MKTFARLLGVGAVVAAFLVVFSPLVAALCLAGLPTWGTMGDMARQGFAPLARSVGFALVSVVFAVGLGLPYAILLERARGGLRRIGWTLGLTVLMVPPYLVAEAVIDLLGPAGKLSRPVAEMLGYGPPSADALARSRFVVPGFVYSGPAVGLVLGGCLFPLVALAVATTLRRTDQRVFDVARLAQGRCGVFTVGVRLVIPPALGAGLLVFALTLTEFAVPQILRVRTIGELIYERIQWGDLAGATTLSLPTLPVILAAGAFGASLLRRSRVASLAGLEGEVPRFRGQAMGMGGSFLSVVVMAAALAPALVLPAVSLVGLATQVKGPSGLTAVAPALRFLDAIQKAWSLLHDDAVRTILMAGLAATIATVFAAGVAWWSKRTRSETGLGILGAGLAVPAPVVGLGLIALWNRGGSVFVPHSSAIVVLAWLARFLPVAVLLAQGAFARVPAELEHAAALAGRGPVGRFVAIILPIAAPGLVAAWVSFNVLAASEYGATGLVVPPGRPLLAPSVVNLVRRGQDPEIAACQILLLAVIAAPLICLASTWFLCAGTGRTTARER